MESLLIELGLNDKEAKVYLFLLEEGEQTATQIANGTRESRTNTYMILERLLNEGLVGTNNNSAVRRFTANNPLNLQKRLLGEQQRLKQANAALQTAMPSLNSLFNLGQHKPGVLYLEGLNGFKTLLEDNARTNKRIDLLASDEAMENQAAWELLQKGTTKRAARGISTRGLFHVSSKKHWQQIKKWENKNYEVRRWGKEPLPGEIVIYGDKVAFTVYKPAFIVAVTTDAVMAQTFRIIFEQLWQGAVQ